MPVMQLESFGKYQVIRKLGQGGMASVYEARDTLIDRQVAIKVVHPHLAREESFAKRFLQEAKLVAALRHQNIVQLYDFDIYDDQPYMVMEYLEGGTLKERVAALRAKGEHLPLGITNQIIRVLAGALDYAHEHEAVHRDIKPANILFTTQGEAVISDFGIAKMLHASLQISLTGGVIGTPIYMSPEQASADKVVDGRSDQYSLTIMVYEMITGRVPFTGNSPVTIFMKHLKEPPPPPREYNPNIPVTVQQVILRALSKGPAERFPTTKDFARAFDQALRGMSPILQPETPLGETLAATQRENHPGTTPQFVPVTPMDGVSDSFFQVDRPENIEQPPSRVSAIFTNRTGAILQSKKAKITGAVVAVLAILALATLGAAGLLTRRITPASGDFIIAVADFDDTQASLKIDFGRRIFEELEAELAHLEADIQVIQTHTVYLDSQAAKQAGEHLEAAILIWGWYDDLGVSPKIEFIQTGNFNSTPRRGSLFVINAQAVSPADSNTASQVDLGNFHSYLRIPRMVTELDLFVENGPQQVTYIAEALLGLAYQSQGDLDTALNLYDKAIVQAEISTLDSTSDGASRSPGLDLVLFHRGLIQTQRNQTPAARQDFESAVKVNPDLFEAHYNLAILYPETCTPARQIELALQAAQSAVNLKPGDSAARLLLAGLHVQTGQYDLASQEIETALRADPNNSEAYLLWGDIYQSRGAATQAEAAYEKSIALLLDGEGGPDFSALGDAYWRAGKIAEALSAYQQADNQDTQRGLGYAFLQTGKYPEAIQEFQTWTEIEPENYAAFNALGLAYLKNGAADLAIESLEQATLLSDCNAIAQLLLGRLYLEQEAYSFAAQAFQAAAIIEPYNASILYILGTTQFFQGKLESAGNSLDQAISLDPNLSIVHTVRGEIYFETGFFNEALAQWQYLLLAYPDDYFSYQLVGNAYEKSGEYEQAAAAYQHSLTLQDDPDTRVYLGLVYQYQGKPDLAIQEYQQALANAPLSFLAQNSLGNALLQTGDLESAAQAYLAALEIQVAPLTRSQLASIYIRQGNIDQALTQLEEALLEEALLEDGNSITIRNQLANLYSRIGRLGEAEAQFLAGLELDPNRPEPHAGLGLLAYKHCDLAGMSREYAQAATLGSDYPFYVGLPALAYAAQGFPEQRDSVLADLLTQFPNDPLAHLFAGEQYWLTDTPEEARQELQVALQSPGFAAQFKSIGRYDLGLVEFEIGNLASAEGELQLALQSFPANTAAWILWGDIALRQQDWESALEYYQHAAAVLPEYGYWVSGDAAELFLPLIQARQGIALRNSGQETAANAVFEQALSQAKNLVELFPNWPQARFALGSVYYILRETEKAQQEFQAALKCDATFDINITRTTKALDQIIGVYFK